MNSGAGGDRAVLPPTVVTRLAGRCGWRHIGTPIRTVVATDLRGRHVTKGHYISVRRALVTVWLLMLNMAVAGIFVTAGEAVRQYVGAPDKGEFAGVVPLACTVFGLGLIIAAWRTSIRIGIAVQIVVPLAVLGVLWIMDYPRLAAAASMLFLLALTVTTGGVVTSLLILAHNALRRRRADSSA
jgi:hypothetical protein